MEQDSTIILGTSDADIERAAVILRHGGLVAFATETVYGLGGDARNGDAVARIYEAKGRPSFNPLIAHVASVEMAKSLVEWNLWADRLASAFWPGPLTLVLPLRDNHGVSSLVTAGLSTLAVRLPANEIARTLLERFGGPIAAPSANPSGRISPTTAGHVFSGLQGRIPAILDAGPCAVGLESTIMGLANEVPTLLRPGGLPIEAIEAALGQPLASRSETDLLSAPGQLLSHYAPNASVRLNATTCFDNEKMLGFGNINGDLNLSKSGDLREAAANLFEFLHQLDATGKPIAIAPIPTAGLGVAINDRLHRAAAPR
ncbi:MAG: L-threonylcarbamoyladenylate synthase [Paracoccaceae bacterium]